MFLTDYDAMPMDVDGEGAPFDLAQARTTTFGRHGMTVAESSPAKPVIDPNWVKQTPHEAPPCEGLLSLYNRGDRRRWYWPCDACGQAFEPAFSLLVWDESPDPTISAESVRMRCPHCEAEYQHGGGNDLPSKYDMNLRGMWLRDGETYTRDGGVVGESRRSEVASYWLMGVAASFKDWKTIVWKWLTAESEYQATGEETTLKATVNTDQCMPYTPKSHQSDRVPEKLRERSFDFGNRVVPFQVSFLVAAIDVQRSSFVVQVTGVSPGGDYWIIDRFSLRHSLRSDPDREGQVYSVRPFTYREDWRLLMREVMLRTYPLGDGSGRHMAIKVTICDSGGMDQGTANSYAFYRWLKQGPQDEDPDKEEWSDWVPGLHSRFQLFKGESVHVGPRVKLTWPDSGRQSRYANARGEIPVLRCNVTSIKNQLDGMLDRKESRTGRVNFAGWLPVNFYKELCVEVKSVKGIWENPRNFRNESWDLLVMTIAVLLDRRHVGIEQIDWDDPPTWAGHWDENEDLVFMPDDDGTTPFAVEAKSKYSLRELAAMLG